MNWIIEEAKKCSSNKNRIILENPAVVRELDELLLHTYYPFLRNELEKSGYHYFPTRGEIKIDSSWDYDNLARSLSFMLFDDFNYTFFRGIFSYSTKGFFLEKNFFLGLPRDTDPAFLFRILSEEKLAGNPPDLNIETSTIYPEWNTYFHITLHAGNGIESGEWNLHNVAKENIKAAIDDSLVMYERSMLDGFSTIDDVEAFLRIACRSYEAF